MSLADFQGDVEKEMTKRFKEIGFLLVSKAREGLNTAQEYKRYNGFSGVYFKGLNPSKPGEFPHKLSGQLLKSMTFESDSNKCVFGSNLAGYPAYLQKGTAEMQTRPWIDLTWQKCEGEINRILNR